MRSRRTTNPAAERVAIPWLVTRDDHRRRHHEDRVPDRKSPGHTGRDHAVTPHSGARARLRRTASAKMAPLRGDGSAQDEGCQNHCQGISSRQDLLHERSRLIKRRPFGVSRSIVGRHGSNHGKERAPLTALLKSPPINEFLSGRTPSTAPPERCFRFIRYEV